MDEFKPGDLITFRIADGAYGLAHIVHVESLSLHENYHLVVYDAVLDAREGVDAFGDPIRVHDFEGVENAPVVIDHLAVTVEGLMESEPQKVGQQDVSETDLDGYRAWLQLRFQEGVRRGMFRPEEENEEEEIEDEEMMDEDIEGEEIEGEEVAEEEAEPEEPREPRIVQVRRWHARVFEMPIDRALFELRDDFAGDDLRSTKLAGIITSRFDANNSEQIDELVQQFVDGDYGAGHELLNFGDAAAGPLDRALNATTSPELADDILRILADMGTEHAYWLVAHYFKNHGDPGDPLYLPAARGYCYAVMLTGGDPVQLRPYLDRLDTIDHPELADDVAAAREAVRTLQPERPVEQEKPSTDPFRTIS